MPMGRAVPFVEIPVIELQGTEFHDRISHGKDASASISVHRRPPNIGSVSVFLRTNVGSVEFLDRGLINAYSCSGFPI
jgi:hypothetical protein